ADPPGHREAPVREMVEEIEFRQQALDADQLPAGRLREHLVEFVVARDRVRRHAETLLVVEELAARAALENLALATEQGRPGLVVGRGIARPRLLDHGGRVDRHVALVGLLVFDTTRRFHGAPPLIPEQWCQLSAPGPSLLAAMRR